MTERQRFIIADMQRAIVEYDRGLGMAIEMTDEVSPEVFEALKQPDGRAIAMELAGKLDELRRRVLMMANAIERLSKTIRRDAAQP